MQGEWRLRTALWMKPIISSCRVHRKFRGKNSVSNVARGSTCLFSPVVVTGSCQQATLSIDCVEENLRSEARIRSRVSQKTLKWKCTEKIYTQSEGLREFFKSYLRMPACFQWVCGCHKALESTWERTQGRERTHFQNGEKKYTNDYFFPSIISFPFFCHPFF